MNVVPIEPGPGQESVWDYPRPPRVESVAKHIVVVFNDVTIVDTVASQRVLETSHPPVYYIPQDDIAMDYLSRTRGSSFCEWKGRAIYYDVSVDGKRAERAAWSYPNPTASFREIKDYLAFYPALMDACYVGGERVKPQPGGFYGGWITSDVVGPFKGEPGTQGW
jgi:uncharacterized protein (DUF427 family)